MKKEISKLITGIYKSIRNLSSSYDDIECALGLLEKARENNNTVYVCGNGGSASTSTHLVCDLSKTAKIKSVCLNDNIALNSALINDIGWEHIYKYMLEQQGKSGDVLIVISTFGAEGYGNHSSNLRNVINYANENGISTIGFSGGNGGYFKHCKCNIIVRSSSIPVIESAHSALAHIIPFTLGEI